MRNTSPSYRTQARIEEDHTRRMLNAGKSDGSTSIERKDISMKNKANSQSLAETLTRIEQDRIVHEILDSLQRTVQNAFDNGLVPADWNGFELRQWIADLAKERYTVDMDKGHKRRYNNVRLITPGL